MSSLRYYLGSIYRVVKNRIFYLKTGKFIRGFFNEHGYKKAKPFNIHKWHHDLLLFTAIDMNGEKVFIKLTKLDRLLKNENRAYKKLQKNEFLKNHVIEHKEYIKKGSYKALVLKQSKGIVLSENWMVNNIDQISTLIDIVDEFTSLSWVHRDIKLDNFIYEEGNIKIFDFSFMIDKTEKRKLKEINLSNRLNMLKLMDLGIYYKPELLKWDDYYSLFIILNNLLKNKKIKKSVEQKDLILQYMDECKRKIDTNSYTILK